MLKLPQTNSLANESVQRTGASHSVELRSRGEGRLAPAADACRYALWI